MLMGIEMNGGRLITIEQGNKKVLPIFARDSWVHVLGSGKSALLGSIWSMILIGCQWWPVSQQFSFPFPWSFRFHVVILRYSSRLHFFLYPKQHIMLSSIKGTSLTQELDDFGKYLIIEIRETIPLLALGSHHGNVVSNDLGSPITNSKIGETIASFA